ncbi:bifunctional 2-polyprenyl-6-hydroxyphenol methylase/3-demethylubiquinol 3-O-methyltransferase UbiG [Flammeovirga sp. EKP202]|uniref:class I SAM-dependent methyltransferase n=1 Tax=Flammeovirga sp. EKP202 TaxID=2770592 RepID=UPI00165F7D14|nr:class I SAM-dependent methyltransferase [Flammeovirga sp. EKP202]MBD0402455.1 class I SAM-dependent methyltransferase [Flammeovirga sp. EKP202]
MATKSKAEEWDAFYQSQGAFGAPYPELVDFLKQIQPKTSLLDLGAGQGRDAIAAQQLGFEVTAVDISNEGIQQIQANGIRGVVDDIFNYTLDQNYQVILLDAVIHCQPEDQEEEKKLFKAIEEHLNQEGYLLLLTHQWDMREQYLQDLFAKHYPTLQLQFNNYIEHIFTPPQTEEESIMELSFMCFQKT